MHKSCMHARAYTHAHIRTKIDPFICVKMYVYVCVCVCVCVCVYIYIYIYIYIYTYVDIHAYISFEMQGGGSTPVTVTRCRDVTKPSGLNPGQVQLRGEVSTIRINLKTEAARLDRLLKTRDNSA